MAAGIFNKAFLDVTKFALACWLTDIVDPSALKHCGRFPTYDDPEQTEFTPTTCDGADDADGVAANDANATAAAD